jgi:hypothetical protein
MNENEIILKRFSNPESEKLYKDEWPDEPEIHIKYRHGEQCGGCSFFAEFDEDWGLCCNPSSRHKYETVFEHFTCPSHVNEGWGPHGFTKHEEFWCKCGGGTLQESIDAVISLLKQCEDETKVELSKEIMRSYLKSESK